MNVYFNIQQTVSLLTSEHAKYRGALHEELDIILCAGASKNEIIEVSSAGIETIYKVEELLTYPEFTAGQYTLYLTKDEAVAARNKRYKNPVGSLDVKSLCLESKSEIFAVSVSGKSLFCGSSDRGFCKFKFLRFNDGTLGFIEKNDIRGEYGCYSIFESLFEAMDYIKSTQAKG